MARSSRFERGCVEYVRTVFPLEIGFPADDVCCKYCEFCHSENGGSRFRCWRTGEILFWYDSLVGERCPLDLPKEYKYTEENET